MEIAVAVILAAFGVLFIVESAHVGAGWNEEGPQTGYFPFYIGLLIVLASCGTIAMVVFRGRALRRHAFVERDRFVRVLRVLIPSALYVALIGYLGIYVSTALFIGLFMRWLGRFGWHSIVPVAILVPVAMFLLFEIWFLVPLPKGPLEGYLGY